MKIRLVYEIKRAEEIELTLSMLVHCNRDSDFLQMLQLCALTYSMDFENALAMPVQVCRSPLS